MGKKGPIGLRTMTDAMTGRFARITLDRPERGNGITGEMPVELARCVDQANLDLFVHVIALSERGKGLCGGYDLVVAAEGAGAGGRGPARFAPRPRTGEFFLGT